MNSGLNPIPEHKFERIIRTVVFAYLIAEGVALAIFAPVALFFAPFMGALAMAGAGYATDEQLKEGWLMIGAVAVSPLLLAILMISAAINLTRRKRPFLIALACIVAILIQIALYINDPVFFGITIPTALIFGFHLAGFTLALRLKRHKQIYSGKFE